MDFCKVLIASEAFVRGTKVARNAQFVNSQMAYPSSSIIIVLKAQKESTNAQASKMKADP